MFFILSRPPFSHNHLTHSRSHCLSVCLSLFSLLLVSGIVCTHTDTGRCYIIIFVLNVGGGACQEKKCSTMGAPRWWGRSRICAGADTGRPTGADRGRAAGRAPGARVLRHTGPGRTHCLRTTYARTTRSIGNVFRTSRITSFFYYYF